jgi:hypothetical protein
MKLSRKSNKIGSGDSKAKSIDGVSSKIRSEWQARMMREGYLYKGRQRDFDENIGARNSQLSAT